MIDTNITDLEDTIKGFFTLNAEMKKLQDELFAVEAEMFYCKTLMDAIKKTSSHKPEIESLQERVC